MADGSPTPLLTLLGAIVAASIFIGRFWPRIRGGKRRPVQRSRETLSPIRFSSSPPPEPDTRRVPQLGISMEVDQYQPDPDRRRMSIKYLLPEVDDVPSRTYGCNLAGINHMSLTGQHRQANIRGLKAGDKLILVRHHSNPHDAHATLALAPNGNDVGYIPAHLADRIARVLDAERAVTAVVDQVEEFESTGGNLLLGVRITVTTWKQRRKPRAKGSPSSQPSASGGDGV